MCFALALGAMLICGQSRDSMRQLPQDLYIWQRVWTPDVASALSAMQGLPHGYRALLGEFDPDGIYRPARPDLSQLRATGASLIGVLRIDGRHLPPDIAVVAGILRANGLQAVEIDFDAPTARLALYRNFLIALRAGLGPDIRLGITALPDWLRAADFPALSAVCDYVVLQVHATNDPRQGLFDPAIMMRALAQMQARSRVPFWVALPSYGVRVVQAQSGRIEATEGEGAPLLGAAGRELVVDPRVADGARALLEVAPPDGLQGIVWFRLPMEADRRAWSLTTMRAILSRHVGAVDLEVATIADATTPGANLIVLRNRGDIDARLPETIALGRDCPAADGMGAYGMRHLGRFSTLVAGRDGLLKARQGLIVGWTRCALAPFSLQDPP